MIVKVDGIPIALYARFRELPYWRFIERWYIGRYQNRLYPIQPEFRASAQSRLNDGSVEALCFTGVLPTVTLEWPNARGYGIGPARRVRAYQGVPSGVPAYQRSLMLRIDDNGNLSVEPPRAPVQYDAIEFELIPSL